MTQRRLHWKRWIILVIVAVVAALLFTYANAPAGGTVVATTPAPAQAAQEVLGNIVFDGPYLTFSYPGTYTVKDHPIETDQFTERISLVDDEQKKRAAVALAPLKTSSFSTEPAILLRRNQHKLYTENPKGLNPHAAQRTLFYRHDDDIQEYSAFWVIGNSLLTVTASSTITDSPVASDFDLLLQTIRSK